MIILFIIIIIICIAIVFYLIKKSDPKVTQDKIVSSEKKSLEPKTIHESTSNSNIELNELTSKPLGKNKFLYPENPMGKLEEGVEYDS
jgi:hypothetical protein